jgi:hypothetical protein
VSEPGSYDYGWEERKRLQRDVDRLTAENAALKVRAAELERERDLAVAHDRQPYPTVEAYETACAALSKHRDRAERMEAEVKRAYGLIQREDALRARVELLELLASDVVDEFDGTIGPALVGAIKTLGAALTPKGGETP